MMKMGLKIRREQGFTLVEILVVIGILAVLASLLFPAVGAVRDRAAIASDGKRLKALVEAYLATEQASPAGILMRGFDDGAQAEVAGGLEVSGAAAARYPWRLAPFLNEQLVDVVLTDALREHFGPEDHYEVSLMPAFGMNSMYVGGEYRGGTPVVGGRNLATRTMTVPDPSRLIVFASAFTKGTGDEAIPGFFRVTPPTRAEVSDNPSQTGNVHYRYNGKALCAFLDGSVRLMGPEELTDMRYWSVGAQLRDDPNWTGRSAPRALR